MKYYISIFSSYILFSLLGIISRNIHFPFFVTLSIMSFFGFFISFVFYYYVNKNIISLFKFDIHSFFVSIIFVFDLTFLFVAFKYVNFSTVIILHYFAPVLVILFNNRKIEKIDLFITSIGFLGIFFIFQDNLNINTFDSNYYLGILFSFLSSFTLAGNIIYQHKYVNKLNNNYVIAVIKYNFYMFLIFSFFLFFIKYDISIIINNINDLYYSILAGIFIQGIAMLLFNYSIQFININNIAKISYSEILFVTFFGFLFYDEVINFLQFIGLMLIVLVNILGVKRINT